MQSDVIPGMLHASGLFTWVTLPVVFLAVAAVMAMIGEGVARAFIAFEPLDAYRLHIGGSLAGMAVRILHGQRWLRLPLWGRQ